MAPSYLDSTGDGSLSSSFSVSKPVGVTAGHLLVAFVAADASATSIGTPTGGATWQALDSVSGFAIGGKVFWKIAGASEPSSYGFSRSSGNGMAAIVVAVSEASASEPLHATSTAGSTTAVTTPTLTPQALGDLDLRFGAGSAFGDTITFSAPSTYTEREDVDGTFVFGTCATKSLSSTSATGTQNFTASTTPTDRLGMTVLVTSPVAGQVRVVTSPAAVHRAATW